MSDEFKKFADADPVMKSIQRSADTEGLGANTKMHYGDFLTIMHAAMRRSFEAATPRFKPMFDHNARLNEDGQMLLNEVTRAIYDLGRGYIRDGFSPREVGHIVGMVALDIELEGVLTLDHQELPTGKSQAPPAPTEAAGKTPAP